VFTQKLREEKADKVSYGSNGKTIVGDSAIAAETAEKCQHRQS
jgi:hypothetical protein